MDSNVISIFKEQSHPSHIETMSLEKRIDDYLQRGSPREAYALKPAKALIDNLHPKGLAHAENMVGVFSTHQTSQELEEMQCQSESETLNDTSNQTSQTLLDRYACLIKENDILKKELKKMETDLNALGPRYKYMERHFEDFIRMKEEYESSKASKIRKDKTLEMKNKGQQTWANSIICETCVKTLDVVESQEFQHYMSSRSDDTFWVTKADMMELEDKFKALKETIAEREREYENRFEKAEIIHLTALNCKYRNQLQELHKKNKQNHSWTNALQRIIAKLCARDELGDLTDQEQGWVERIVDKYLSIEEVTKQPAFNATDSRNSIPTSDRLRKDR